MGLQQERNSAFIDVIEGAGYEVIFIDLEREEIPKDCRMIICFAPTRDFYAYGSLGELGVSEIEKLDRYLDAAHSFFYVCDRDTPKLPALEEYLYEWVRDSRTRLVCHVQSSRAKLPSESHL